MQYTINLTAGQELRAQISGRTMALLSTGTATSVDMKLEITGFAVEELRAQKRGFKVRTPGFDGVRFLSSVDTQIEVFTSVADIDLSLEGQTVSATITNTPLAVVPDRGAPANPVYVTGITYSDAPATSMLNTGPVAATSTVGLIVAASATRKAVRFTNVGTNDVAIGAAGLTWAKRCIILSAGDTWVEERGANLAWYAICDATKTTSINAQEVLA